MLDANLSPAQRLHATLAERDTLATALQANRAEVSSALALVSDLNGKLERVVADRDQLASALEARRAESDADRVQRDATMTLVSELQGELERITIELQLRHRALVASCESEAAPDQRVVASGLGSPSRQGWHVEAIRTIVQLGERRIASMAGRVEELVAERTTLSARNRDLIEKLRARSRSDTLELEGWRTEVADVAVGLIMSLEQVAATLAGTA